MKLDPETIRELLAQLEEHGWDELRLEIGSERLVLRRRATGESSTTLSGRANAVPRHDPAPGPTPALLRDPAPAPVAEPDSQVIRAAHVGIFWRRPNPASPPYVEVGDRVEADTTLGLIEVMKLFTPVLAGRAGTVVEVLIEDARMVEFGSALFRLAPPEADQS